MEFPFNYLPIQSHSHRSWHFNVQANNGKINKLEGGKIMLNGNKPQLPREATAFRNDGTYLILVSDLGFKKWWAVLHSPHKKGGDWYIDSKGTFETLKLNLKSMQTGLLKCWSGEYGAKIETDFKVILRNSRPIVLDNGGRKRYLDFASKCSAAGSPLALQAMHPDSRIVTKTRSNISNVRSNLRAKGRGFGYAAKGGPMFDFDAVDGHRELFQNGFGKVKQVFDRAVDRRTKVFGSVSLDKKGNRVYKLASFLKQYNAELLDQDIQELGQYGFTITCLREADFSCKRFWKDEIHAHVMLTDNGFEDQKRFGPDDRDWFVHWIGQHSYHEASVSIAEGGCQWSGNFHSLAEGLRKGLYDEEPVPYWSLPEIEFTALTKP